MPAPMENLALFSMSNVFWMPAPMENLARFSTIGALKSAENDDEGATTMAPAMKAAAICRKSVDAC